jgi:hypothetical protein
MDKTNSRNNDGFQHQHLSWLPVTTAIMAMVMITLDWGCHGF